MSNDEYGREILNSPVYTNEQKTEFFESVLTGRLDVEAKNLISLLAEYNRMGLLSSISGNLRADESTPSKNPGG